MTRSMCWACMAWGARWAPCFCPSWPWSARAADTSTMAWPNNSRSRPSPWCRRRCSRSPQHLPSPSWRTCWSGCASTASTKPRAWISPPMAKPAITSTFKALSRGNRAMKLVTAIVQPHRLDNVRLALTEIGIAGLTVTEVRGYGRQKGHTEIYRGAEYTISFLPKLKIEVALPDERVDDAIAAITRAARTGKIGDGKIFVLDLESAIRVRTGETGDSAL